MIRRLYLLLDILVLAHFATGTDFSYNYGGLSCGSESVCKPFKECAKPVTGNCIGWMEEVCCLPGELNRECFWNPLSVCLDKCGTHNPTNGFCHQGLACCQVPKTGLQGLTKSCSATGESARCVLACSITAIVPGFCQNPYQCCLTY